MYYHTLHYRFCRFINTFLFYHHILKIYIYLFHYVHNHIWFIINIFYLWLFILFFYLICFTIFSLNVLHRNKDQKVVLFHLRLKLPPINFYKPLLTLSITYNQSISLSGFFILAIILDYGVFKNAGTLNVYEEQRLSPEEFPEIKLCSDECRKKNVSESEDNHWFILYYLSRIRTLYSFELFFNYIYTWSILQ